MIHNNNFIPEENYKGEKMKCDCCSTTNHPTRTISFTEAMTPSKQAITVHYCDLCYSAMSDVIAAIETGAIKNKLDTLIISPIHYLCYTELEKIGLIQYKQNTTTVKG